MSSEEFDKIVKDFKRDICLTFPEYKEKINEEHDYEYYKNYYPQHFFNILYQNEEIFDSSGGSFFLPDINFNDLWKEDITDKTKEIIWKYLQLILFTVVNNEKSGEDLFGDTEKLFEAIDEETFKKKISESIDQMSDLFDNEDLSGCAPDAEKLHEHISGILDGNLGKLAKEIAEETAAEINMDPENMSSIGDVFQKLMKNPAKLMGIIKKIGNKIEEKIKSGEIKESEMMEEAGELLKKMKSMPGMKNMKKMFAEMGLPFSKNMNMGAMQASIDRNLKGAKTRERLKKKLEQRKQDKKDVEFEQQKDLLKQLLEGPKKEKKRKGKKKKGRRRRKKK